MVTFGLELTTPTKFAVGVLAACAANWGAPILPIDLFETVCKGRCILRQRLIRLATAVGSVMALLVAGGARWKY
jgi:hypothetical protein